MSETVGGYRLAPKKLERSGWSWTVGCQAGLFEFRQLLMASDRGLGHSHSMLLSGMILPRTLLAEDCVLGVSRLTTEPATVGGGRGVIHSTPDGIALPRVRNYLEPARELVHLQ